MPTDLLDRGRQRLSGIFCLRGSQADELGPCKGERRGDESAAKAFETIVEGSRVVPQTETHVASIWPALAIDATHDVDEDAQEAGHGVSTESFTTKIERNKKHRGRVRTYILSQP